MPEKESFKRKPEDYFQTYKKMKKVLCFSIVSIQQYPVTNLVLKKKLSEVNNNFQSFEKSRRTFLQKGTDHRSLDFFSFGNQNQFAYL